MSNFKQWHDSDLTKAKKKITIKHNKQREEEWIKEQEEALEHLNDEDQLGDNSEIAHT
jgi:hypothetical protein